MCFEEESVALLSGSKHTTTIHERPGTTILGGRGTWYYVPFNTRVQLGVALRNEADDAVSPGEETKAVMCARLTRQVQGCRPALLPAVWQWRWTFVFLWRMSVRVAHNTAAMRARFGPLTDAPPF